MIQILLVDDHPLMCEGTKLIIEKEKNMKVYTETSCAQALNLVKSHNFDVMIFDLQMPEMSGIELTKQVLAIKPNACVLIYTDIDIFPFFDKFMDCGAIGFISKTDTKEELFLAIHSALHRKLVIPHSMFKKIYLGSKPLHQELPNKNIPLNEKEKVILSELVKGKTNKEIAQTLFIGQRTLEYSLTALFQKLGVKTRIEAALLAKEIYN